LNNQRYNRQLILSDFGEIAQQKLTQLKVLVIGAGGLGVPVLQYLTGMGVGAIGIMDGDTIHLSNLHRQVLYNEAEVGLNKATVATQKLQQLNSIVHFKTISQHLTTENALATITDYDLIIDATDNFTARYLINDACVILKKPYIYGAIHQYEGQVSVFNFEGGPTYRCLYPQMPAANEIPDCNTGGVLGVAPGIIGCHMALEAVKVITGLGQNLSGRLQIFDLLHNSQYTLQLKTNTANLQITSLQNNYDLPGCANIPNLSINELLQWIESGKKFILLDLRDEEDFEAAHVKDALYFTTQVLKNKAANFNIDIPVAAICYRGHRSLQAAAFLREKYSQLPVYNVGAGMEGWLNEIGDKYLIHE
jgi:sulfur-carrier protein adenylyltransferase/sulfurtransferase